MGYQWLLSIYSATKLLWTSVGNIGSKWLPMATNDTNLNQDDRENYKKKLNIKIKFQEFCFSSQYRVVQLVAIGSHW